MTVIVVVDVEDVRIIFGVVISKAVSYGGSAAGGNCGFGKEEMTSCVNGGGVAVSEFAHHQS